MKKQFEKWIVLPDLQIPYEDTKTLLAVEQFMRDEASGPAPWDGWLQLGDFLDFNELSRFNYGKEQDVVDDVLESFTAGNTFLDRHQTIIKKGNRNARFVLLEGNHDFRAKEYASTNEGKKWKKTLNYRRQLRLEERRVEWIECWEDKSKTFALGNARFIHGNYTNQYHANKMVQRYGCPIYYGHLHDVMEMPMVQMGPDKSLIGKSLGCLCRYDQKYLKGNPTNWTQAFAIFLVFPDGNFTEHTVRIYNHRFALPDGRVYDGKKIFQGG